MTRFLLLVALSALIAALATAGILRLIGASDQPAVVAAVAGAVAALTAIGTIPRSQDPSEAEEGARERA
jgi:hypothetical protein